MIGSQKFVPLVSGTTWRFAHTIETCCDWLSKFVPLVSGTTICFNTLRPSSLWLALKSLYLWYLEQLIRWQAVPHLCCDWLSKVCTFGIWNNIHTVSCWLESVVIGSQKFVPLVSGTTLSSRKRQVLVVIGSQKFVPLVSGTTKWKNIGIKLLWLALKSLYLWYLEQRAICPSSLFPSCDWLSKVCTFGIWNNFSYNFWFTPWLWLALKSLYLWYLEQLQL